MEVKTIRNVDEKTCGDFKKNNGNFWSMFLNQGNVLSEEEAKYMSKLSKDMRKEF